MTRIAIKVELLLKTTVFLLAQLLLKKVISEVVSDTLTNLYEDSIFLKKVWVVQCCVYWLKSAFSILKVTGIFKI